MKDNFETQRAAAHDTEATDEDIEFIKRKFADEPSLEPVTTSTDEEIISDEDRERMAREAEEMLATEAEVRGAELPED